MIFSRQDQPNGSSLLLLSDYRTKMGVVCDRHPYEKIAFTAANQVLEKMHWLRIISSRYVIITST